MQYIDQPKMGRHAILSPQMAVISGQIKTNSVDDLRQFERSFNFDPRVVVELSKDVFSRTDLGEKEDGTVDPEQAGHIFSPKEKTDIFFKELIPRIYDANRAPGWTANLYFDIEGAGDYTVSVQAGGVRIADGKEGEPDANISMDVETFSSVMRFEVLDDANQMKDLVVVDDESRSLELSDDQLELVAGGKGGGSCGAEASGASACGSDHCGAAASGATAAGASACGVAVGAAGVCGGDACGAAAGVATACGGAACAAAAGAGTACGGDGCVAAAGAGSACGAAVCGAAACAGDACGVATCTAAACAAAACGADVAPGPDFGPCAINVIPCCPFI